MNKEFKSLHFEVTHRCNLRCLHCYNINYIESSNKDLDLQDVKRIVDIAKDLGCEHIGYSGGEPFARKDFLEILAYTPKNPIHILTNGLLITEDAVKKITKANDLVEMRISLDGLESHKIMRNVEYNKIIEKIRLLKSYDYIVTVNTMVTPYNTLELKTMYDLMVDLEVDRWRIDFIFNYGNADRNSFLYSETVLTFQTLKDLISRYLTERPFFEFDVNKFFRSTFLEDSVAPEYTLDSVPCDYQASLTIRPDGGVAYCPSMDFVFGNILLDPIEKILQSNDWKRFSEIKVRDLDSKCTSCELMSMCGGGCRADAYYSCGNYYGFCQFNCDAMYFLKNYINPVISEFKANNQMNEKKQQV